MINGCPLCLKYFPFLPIYSSLFAGCCGEKQIVSLGAGFDTTYFRMLEKSLLQDTYFIEVDLPDVIRRKMALARKGELFSLSSEENPKQIHKECVYHRL